MKSNTSWQSKTLNGLRIAFLIFIILVAGFAAIFSAIGIYYWPGLGKEVEQLKNINSLLEEQLEMPLQVFSKDEKLLAVFGEHRRKTLTYDEIPQNFINAILAAEDDEFFEHFGVDLKGLVRSVLELISTGSKQTGASTITMQTARNYLLTLDITFTRKFREILLSLYMEQVLTKQQIMELYINKIFLGNRAYGIAAAAEVYYGKPISDLTLAQYAMIAGIPKAPSKFNPLANSRRALIRRNWILKRMYSLQMISYDEYSQAIKEPVTAKYHAQKMELEAPFVAEMARLFVQEKFGETAYTKGLKVYTSIDSKLQTYANASLIQGLLDYDKRHGFRGFEARNIEASLPEEDLNPDELQDLAEDKQAIENIELALKDDRKERLKSILGIDVSNWLQTLDRTPTYGGLQPAIVVKAEQEAIYALIGSGDLVYIPAQNFAWAGKYVTPTWKVQEAPSGDKLTKKGDLIRVELMNEYLPVEFEVAKQVEDVVFGTQDKDLDKDKIQVAKFSQIPNIQGGLVALNPKTGYIEALVGGFDYNLSKYNRVEQAIRQAGSIFKPFVYLSALEKGYTAATIINDAPIVIEDSNLEGSWRPKNSDGKFEGATRMREGLYKSRNLVSIRILQDIGIEYGRNYVLRFGFRDESLPHNLSLALGAVNVTPLEMARGYAALANGGYKVDTNFIEKVEDVHGELVYQSEPAIICSSCGSKTTEIEYGGKTRKVAPRVVDDTRSLYIMDSMLQDVIKKGTARAAKVLERNDLHGKTGTTNNQEDAWFSGFNGNLIATIWTGFDQPASTGEYGSNLALPIWIDFMQNALANQPYSSMYRPSGLVTVRINPETGERALAGEDGIFEIFKQEQAPKQPQQSIEDFAPPSTTGEESSTTGMPESLF